MKVLMTLIAVQLFSAPAAFGYIYAELEVAHSGKCIKASPDSAESILRRNGIKPIGSYSSHEINALAKGIAQVERINGGPLPAAWHTQFNFLNARGAWNQGPNAVNVRKLSYGGDNVGALMHEFGHKVANADGQKILNRYVGSTPRCGFTGYARSKRSEEFAEVFSAFITNPDDLKAKCPSSYATLKRIFNAGENVSMASCSGKKPAVAAAAAGSFDDETSVQTAR
jgi:hypothetical protein